MEELLEVLKRAEVALHHRSVRRDSSMVDRLLHESFFEFGRSGASYDRAAILDLLAHEDSVDRVLSQDFAVRSLGIDTALLTYRSATVDHSGAVHRHTLRASVWVRTPDGWKLFFHQGTPTEAFEIAACER